MVKINWFGRKNKLPKEQDYYLQLHAVKSLDEADIQSANHKVIFIFQGQSILMPMSDYVTIAKEIYDKAIEIIGETEKITVCSEAD